MSIFFVREAYGEGGMSTFFQTHTGLRIDPLRPCADHVRIEDIAHALARICRFGGHCAAFYSVAQHSVLLSFAAERLGVTLSGPGHGSGALAAARWALLHDAAEAYLGDLIAPIKYLPGLAEYRLLEQAWQEEISLALGLFPLRMPDAIRDLDKRLLADEALALMPGPHDDWPGMGAPLGVKIEPRFPREAEALFLERFSDLEMWGMTWRGNEVEG